VPILRPPFRAIRLRLCSVRGEPTPSLSAILSSTASSLPRPRDRANGNPLAVFSGPTAPGARPLSVDEQRAHRGGVERARDHELRCSRSALSRDAGLWARTSLGSVHARVTLLPAFVKTTRFPGPAARSFATTSRCCSNLWSRADNLAPGRRPRTASKVAVGTIKGAREAPEAVDSTKRCPLTRWSS